MVVFFYNIGLEIRRPQKNLASAHIQEAVVMRQMQGKKFMTISIGMSKTSRLTVQQ